MILEKVVAGPLDTNAYLVGCEKSKKGMIIDPGFESSERLLLLVKKHEISVQGIYLTHTHFDHIADVARLKKEKGWPVYVHPKDAQNLIKPGSDGILARFGFLIDPVEPDGFLNDGDEIELGEMRFKVIHTPGHSEGSVVFYFEEEKVLISGDTLFKGTYGRVDLPTSDPEKMKASLAKIKQLPDDILVYPGHGGLTKMEREKRWL